MTATIGTFTHYCSEKHCGGEVLETITRRIKLMKKISLTFPNGQVRTFNDLTSAQAFATKHNITIKSSL